MTVLDVGCETNVIGEKKRLLGVESFELGENFRVTFGINGKISNWSLLKDVAVDYLLKYCNLREICKNEVVLDFENKEVAKVAKLRLDKDKMKYNICPTTSRGYHFHMKFDGLLKYESALRTYIRRQIIEHYGADVTKSSERTVISILGKSHWKLPRGSNGVKSVALNCGFPGNNEIPWFVDTELPVNGSGDIELGYKLDGCKDFLKYIMEHEIPDGLSRNNILFKNLMVLFVGAKMEYEEIKDVGSKIVSNCPHKTVTEFIGWHRKVSESSFVSEAELNRFVNSYNSMPENFDKPMMPHVKVKNNVTDET